MATTIQLKHKTSGIVKEGFYGFSWTTLFFGCFPALFRKDFITFIGAFAVLFILTIATAGVGTFIAMIAWAFIYNSYYTKKLLENGYELSGSPSENSKAAAALNVTQSFDINTPLGKFKPDEMDLSNDAYKIFLTKKYKIEKNEVLGKFICLNKLFDNVDDALNFAHQEGEIKSNQTKTAPIKSNGCVDCPQCGGENFPDQYSCRYCDYKLTIQQ